MSDLIVVNNNPEDFFEQVSRIIATNNTSLSFVFHRLIQFKNNLYNSDLYFCGLKRFNYENKPITKRNCIQLLQAREKGLVTPQAFKESFKCTTSKDNIPFQINETQCLLEDALREVYPLFQKLLMPPISVACNNAFKDEIKHAIVFMGLCHAWIRPPMLCMKTMADFGLEAMEGSLIPFTFSHWRLLSSQYLDSQMSWNCALTNNAPRQIYVIEGILNVYHLSITDLFNLGTTDDDESDSDDDYSITEADKEKIKNLCEKCAAYLFDLKEYDMFAAGYECMDLMSYALRLEDAQLVKEYLTLFYDTIDHMVNNAYTLKKHMDIGYAVRLMSNVLGRLILFRELRPSFDLSNLKPLEEKLSVFMVQCFLVSSRKKLLEGKVLLPLGIAVKSKLTDVSQNSPLCGALEAELKEINSSLSKNPFDLLKASLDYDYTCSMPADFASIKLWSDCILPLVELCLKRFEESQEIEKIVDVLFLHQQFGRTCFELINPEDDESEALNTMLQGILYQVTVDSFRWIQVHTERLAPETTIKLVLELANLEPVGVDYEFLEKDIDALIAFLRTVLNGLQAQEIAIGETVLLIDGYRNMLCHLNERNPDDLNSFVQKMEALCPFLEGLAEDLFNDDTMILDEINMDDFDEGVNSN